MGVIVITEDFEILDAVKFYIEREMGITLSRPEKIGNVEKWCAYGYKVGTEWLYTFVGGGYGEAINLFRKIVEGKYYKMFKDDGVKAIFLYFDKDVEDHDRRELGFNAEKVNYKGFHVYLLFLGKRLKLCEMEIKAEFETLLLEKEKEEIENKLCGVIREREINKASLIFPLKLIILYNQKPRVRNYLCETGLDLKEELKIKEIVKYLKNKMRSATDKVL